MLVVPLLIYSLLGQGTLSVLVLCIGEDDHVAVELDHHDSGAPSLSLRSGEVETMVSLKEGRGSCLDIPLQRLPYH